MPKTTMAKRNVKAMRKSPEDMGLQELREYSRYVADLLAQRVQKEKGYIQGLLAEFPELLGGAAKKRGRPPGSGNKQPGMSSRKGVKVPAKFRSLKDASLTWSGRGLRPKWLVVESKGKKSLDAFLIK